MYQIKGWRSEREQAARPKASSSEKISHMFRKTPSNPERYRRENVTDMKRTDGKKSRRTYFSVALRKCYLIEICYFLVTFTE